MEKRILIADDHGVVRLGLSMMIKKLRPDFIVDEADDYQKVMIFSSQDENLFAVRYLKMGADGFLHKLSSEEVINKALTKMLDKGRYMSEEVKESLIYSNLNNQEASPNPLEVLSDREMEIAERLIVGEPMKVISRNLNIHSSTVSTYKSRILEKLHIQSIPELIEIFNLHEISRD